MPNYMYVCKCGHKQEMQHSIHIDPQVRCIKCTLTMERRPQGALVRFMGGGFYTNDSKKPEK